MFKSLSYLSRLALVASTATLIPFGALKTVDQPLEETPGIVQEGSMVDGIILDTLNAGITYIEAVPGNPEIQVSFEEHTDPVWYIKVGQSGKYMLYLKSRQDPPLNRDSSYYKRPDYLALTQWFFIPHASGGDPRPVGRVYVVLEIPPKFSPR